MVASVDLFAGGGGASLGIQWATGHSPVAAVNHDEGAIAMHRRNHPDTLHFQDDVFEVSPYAAVSRAQGDVDLLWASPDCRHFSRAKGGKPRSKKIRGLAWVVVDWALALRPRMICMENVSEFQTWGPLDEFGHPIKARAGETFREFVGKLEALGYRVEWRVLNAADYGSPTLRRRLFLIGRRDGLPIVWPEPTHGPGRGEPYRTASECIDWSIPCPSIFARKKPLADATLRRIAHGVVRYVLNDPSPFIVNLTHGGRTEPISEPFRTITGANRGEKAIIAPYFIPRHGERPGQEPRIRRADRPMPTVTATANGATLVAAFLAKHYGGVVGHDLKRPIGTVTAQDHHSLVAAHLTKFYGSCKDGVRVDAPAPTITGQGQHAGVVAAFLAAYYGTEKDGQSLAEPMRTITSRARFGLVTVEIEGVPHVITDIGMRMLTPRELARAQGFPDDYLLVGTKTAQIARIGNSVCPQVVEAIVGANVAASRKASA